MFVRPRAEIVLDPAGKVVRPGRKIIPDGLVPPGPWGIGGVPGTGDGRLISLGFVGTVGGGLSVFGWVTPGELLGGVAGVVCADKEADNQQPSRKGAMPRSIIQLFPSQSQDR